MKRRLFVFLLSLVLGGEVLPSLGYQPQVFDRVVAWWNAPPAPPSPEAQKLIASLENGDGWKVSGMTGPSLNRPVVKRGDIYVTVRVWHADVSADGVCINDSLSFSESAAINTAAEQCLRKLTAKTLETAVK